LTAPTKPVGPEHDKREIAVAERIEDYCANRALRLTLLASAIVEAILDGRQVPGAHLPAPSHRAHRRKWLGRLGDDPRLLVVRPAPPSARSGQNLGPPIANARRVVADAIHNDVRKPAASAHGRFDFHDLSLSAGQRPALCS